MKPAMEKLFAGGVAVLVASVLVLGVAGLDRPVHAAAAAVAVEVPAPSGIADLRQPGVHRARVVFAGGCFWGVQGVFQHVKGVDSAVSGYIGGSGADARYPRVSAGNTGHAEAVQVTYDPSQVSYAQLMQVFFSVVHDPTQHDRQGPDRGNWLDIHQQLFDEKLLHGMEVANGDSYYPRAHQWCLDRNLTMLGNSDIHAPDLRRKSTATNHRTCTLVFVTEPSIEGIRQALTERRTAVWLGNQVIGRSEWLEPLFKACLEIEAPHLRAGDTAWVRVRNRSPFDLRLRRTAGPGPNRADLPAETVSLLKVRVPADGTPVEFAYTVENFLVAPETGLPVVHRVAATQ